VTLWGYVADPLIFVANKEVWESWTVEDRRIVKDAAVEAASRSSNWRERGWSLRSEHHQRRRETRVNVVRLKPEERQAL